MTSGGASTAGQGRGRRREHALALLAFGGLAALLLFDSLLLGRLLVPYDVRELPPWSESVSRGVATGRRSGNPMLDSVILTVPWRTFGHESLGRGELPFWNPYILCGYPQLALVQSNALHPLTLPFDAVDPLGGLAYSAAAHLALAGLSMFAFLRARGLGFAAAVLGGAAFELNGMFLARLGTPSYLFSGAWLPLMLHGTDRLARGEPPRRAWTLGLGTTMAFLGGHPQIFVLSAFAAIAYLAARLALEPPSAAGAGRCRRALRFAAMLVLGLGIAGYQAAPFIELLGETARSGVSLDEHLRTALPLAGLAQALLPNAFGDPTNGTYWFGRLAELDRGIPAETRLWGVSFVESNVFDGWAPPFLAAIALLARPRAKDVAFFAALGLFGLAAAFGTPLLGVAHGAIPAFRHSRPERVLYLYFVAVSALAAHGFDAYSSASWDRATARGRLRFPGRALLLLALLALLFVWAKASRQESWDAVAVAAARWGVAEMLRRHGLDWPLLLEAGVALAVLVLMTVMLARPLRPSGALAALWPLLLVGPALWFGWRLNPTQEQPLLPPDSAVDFLREQPGLFRVARVDGHPYLASNVAQLLGLFDVNGATAAGIGRYFRLAASLDPRAVAMDKYFPDLPSPDSARSRVLDLLNVRFVLSKRDLELPVAFAKPGSDWRIYDNPDALPRFFVVHRSEELPDERQALRRLAAADFEPGSVVLLPPGKGLPGGGPATPGGVSTVEVVSYAPTRVELRVSGDRPGILVSSETYYPGWRSRVDDRPAETLLANGAFRAVHVAAGDHRVSLHYVPVSFYLGLAVSASSLLAAGLWFGPRKAARDDGDSRG